MAVEFYRLSGNIGQVVIVRLAFFIGVCARHLLYITRVRICVRIRVCICTRIKNKKYGKIKKVKNFKKSFIFLKKTLDNILLKWYYV